MPPTRGVTIRIFLVDGTPQGLRLLERMGWTGSFLAFARADYLAARARPEVSRTGVYVLLGPDHDGRRPQRVYIGEADAISTRLDAHQKAKDFWTQGFVLTTKDNSLNKAHGRYLEARLLALAAAADNASLDNGTAPPPPGLGEQEVAEMETYLDNVLPLFPLVGVNVFEPAEEPAAGESSAGGPSGEGATRLLLKTQLTDAQGEDRSRGFLVFEGALGRREKKVIDSPSAAASVLSGGNKNGRTEWKDAVGRSLKELQEQTAS